jgi:hypothetical protein
VAPSSDLADLAAAPVAHVDQPVSASAEEVEQLWATEIERRAERVLAGESHGEPWHEVRSRIEGGLAAG